MEEFSFHLVLIPFYFSHGCFYAFDSQEYTEEFRDIAAGKVKKGPSVVGDQGNITLLHQRPVGDDLPVIMTFLFVLPHFVEWETDTIYSMNTGGRPLTKFLRLISN